MRHALRSIRAVIAVLLLPLACTEPVRFGPAAKLAFVVQPSAAVHDAAFSPAIVVAIQDDEGRTVTSATNSVTLEIASNPSTGTLLGTTTVEAVKGVATFTGLTIDKPGFGYRLTASSAGLTSTSSNSFEIRPGPATKLGFIVQPTDVIHDQPINVLVAVQDDAGYTVTSVMALIHIKIGANSSTASLAGLDTARTSQGIASFSGLRISNLGADYTLVASSATALAQATSEPFDVTTGPAARLTFAMQPSSTGPGETIVPPVVVAVTDEGGYTVTNSTTSVTLAIGNNPGGGSLSGTTTVASVNGQATFPGLSINNTGVGYTLIASATGLPNLTSNRFLVRTPLTFASLSSGYFHGCGIATDGTGYCWGNNDSGQGGNDADTPSPPTAILGNQTFMTVSAGRDHSCGLTSAGAAYCWGANSSGKLGVGSTSDKHTPNAVSGNLTFAQISAGYAHTCGVTPAGAGYCWGDNGYGELGLGNTSSGNTAPVALPTAFVFSTMSAGRFFTCGLTTGQDAYCWGDNFLSELGDGTQVARSVPTAVSGLLKFASVIAGGFHSCGLTTAGKAYCWGANDVGQIGDGTTTRRSTPTAVSTALTFTSLTVGNRHACALTAAGVAYCWGDGSNHALGDGTTDRHTTPSPVSGGLTFASISAGRFHTCGVTTSNGAFCWGDNVSGVLGDGTTNNSGLPLRVR